MKKLLLGAVAALALSARAQAIPIITFGESPPASNLFNITDLGTGVTSLLATNVPITISFIDGSLGGSVPFAGTFSLTGLSTDAATTAASGTIFIQQFSGSYSILSPTCGASHVCLSGSYVDDMSGLMGGHALALDASQPPNSVTMSSDPAAVPNADLQLPRAIAFALSNVLPPVGEDCAHVECTLVSSSAVVSGNASASRVPEPFSLAVLGLGLTVLGLVRRRA